MSFISDFIERGRERKRKMQEVEDNERIYSGIEQKKLSHGERELIKVLENEKQHAIKDALWYEERRRQADEKIKARNMMKFNPEFFNNDVVLKQKKIFLGGDGFLWR